MIDLAFNLLFQSKFLESNLIIATKSIKLDLDIIQKYLIYLKSFEFNLKWIKIHGKK